MTVTSRRRDQNRASSEKRRDIQGLRALAVLLVVADHLFRLPTGGFVGVDVFFVISGFLITGILLREHEKTGHISFRNFYARRLRRIVPAATVVIIATLIGAYFLFPFGRFQTIAVDGIWSSLFAGNWHMAAVGVDYFQLGQPPSPLQHYWSLSVEEQFYFVWPWLMLGLFAVFAKLRRGSGLAAVTVTMSVIVAASFVWSLVQSSAEPTIAYFSTFTRAWELGVGAILALLAPIVSRLPQRIRPLLGWAGLAGIITSAVLITAELPFPGPWALAPVLSTALVIAAGTGDEYRMLPLTNRVSTYIGDISYSLYLWHFPVIGLLLAVAPEGSVAYVAGSLAAMFALAVLSYHFVENAFRPSRAPVRTLARAWPRIVVGATVVALIGVISLGATGAPQATAKPAPVVTNSTDTTIDSCFGAAYIANADTCTTADLPNSLYPTVEGLFNDSGDTFLCFRDRDMPMKTCHYGDDAAPLKVALVGDSHAAQLLTPIRASLETLGWSLDTYLGYGCQFQSPVPPDCPVMSDIIAALHDGGYDLIVTSGARWVGGDSDDYSSAYASAWADATADGAKVIVVADVPQPSDDAIACISRVGFDVADNDCGTDEKDALARTDPLLAAVRASDKANVALIDLSSFYCESGFCPSVIGGVQVYRDTGAHMSGTWLISLGPYLVAALLAAQPQP